MKVVAGDRKTTKRFLMTIVRDDYEVVDISKGEDTNPDNIAKRYLNQYLLMNSKIYDLNDAEVIKNIVSESFVKVCENKDEKRNPYKKDEDVAEATNCSDNFVAEYQAEVNDLTLRVCVAFFNEVMF